MKYVYKKLIFKRVTVQMFISSENAKNLLTFYNSLNVKDSFGITLLLNEVSVQYHYTNI